MNYKLQFLPSALKEWRKLDSSIQKAFKKKLEERLKQPHVPASGLSGFVNHYKIKLKTIGYRLVYEVNDQTITVTVIAVGKRDHDLIYKKARKRSEA